VHGTVGPERRRASTSYGESRGEPKDPGHEKPRWDLWLYGTVVVALLLVAATGLSPWLRNEWALSLGRQTTPYTQLGFSSAATLPATAARGKGIPVSFVITNDTGKQVAYQYVVASGTSTKLESLTSATKVVAAGASWDVAITVVPKCAESACRIQVSLPQQGESIDFLLTLQSKSRIKIK
jgi:hypothetical protein